MRDLFEFHEFTWDMIRGLPRAYYCEINNIPYSFTCKKGLKDLYYFVNNIVEKDYFDNRNNSESYNIDPPPYALQEWTPPPLKDRYKGLVQFEKPTVVIQNKYAVEWLTGIYNYYPLHVLGEIFSYLKDKYDLIYIRPKGESDKYFKDDNVIKPFRDYEFIKEEHPYVYTIEDFIKNYPQQSYNTLQMILEATSDRHLTVSGGNACISAYFGGDVIIYDSPEGLGAGRGVWKTDSWLKNLSGANIYGCNSYEQILNKVKELW